MFYTVEKVKRSAHIFAIKCPIVMGFELKVAFLRGHNWLLLAHMPLCTVTLNSKLSYLKNLKLFSIRVKELPEPIVL